MYWPLVCWLLLFAPGYVLVRRTLRDTLDAGLPAMFALAYAGTFLLLTPISIAAYVFHLPAVVMSGAMVTLALAALVWLTVKKCWGELGRLALAAAGFELAVLLVDMVFGWRVGAFLAGDAQVHLARIRHILDHGFSNLDPFVETPWFFKVYHTNIVYAMQAGISRLTGDNYLAVWSSSWPWAKLVSAGGAYFLAWTIFKKRWAGWVAAMFVVAVKCSVPFVVYPNQLSSAWLLPVAVAFGIRVLRDEGGRRDVIALAAVSLLLGQVHGLYAVFAGMVIAPVLVAAIVRRLVRKDRDWRLAAWGVAALTAGAPFVLVSNFAGRAPEAETAAKSADEQVTEEPVEDENFIIWDSGLLMLRPEVAAGNRGAIGLTLLAGGAGLVLAMRKSVPAGAAVGIAASTAVWLFVPPAAFLAVKILGAPWMLARLNGLLLILVGVLLFGGAAALLDRWVRLRWAQGLLSLLVVLWGLAYQSYEPAWGYKEYQETVRKPAEERRARFEYELTLQAFFREHLPPGEVVLSDGRTGRHLVMLYDAYILAPDRSSPGANAMPERKAAQAALLSPRTAWAEAAPLLEQYGINYLLVSQITGTRRGPGWQPHYADIRQGPGVALVRLQR